MKALVIGGDSFIGKHLAAALEEAGHSVKTTSRKGDGDLHFDLMEPTKKLPKADAVFICAAMTRFIDCEADPLAWRCNVDAPVEIGRQYGATNTQVVYFSSEAVERALHTNYGMHKAMAEMGLRAVCDPIIARISKVTPETVYDLCRWLVELAAAKKPGIYRWNGVVRHQDCRQSPHGCRLVSDGAVCSGPCQWLQ